MQHLCKLHSNSGIVFQAPEPAETGVEEPASAAAAPEAAPSSGAAAPATEAQEGAAPEEPKEAAEPDAAPAQQGDAEERGKASGADSKAGALLFTPS